MEKQAESYMERINNRRSLERGFTILQLVITVGVIGIVSTFALISVARARDNIRLQGSVRQLAGYLEKARLDAVRRHATSSVAFTSTTTYSVTMDFDGTGVVGTRSYSFDGGISVISTPLPSISFNWRGRTSACTQTFAMQNLSGDQSWVDVSDAGDVTVNSDVDVLPTVSYSTVSSTGDVNSGTVVTGAGVHNNSVDCGGTGSVVTTTPVTGNGASGCSLSASPGGITIRKGGGTSGTITLSVRGTSSNVTPSGPSNLQISPTARTIAAGSSGTFTVTSLNNTRGTFAVNFTSSCTTVTVSVKVTN